VAVPGVRFTDKESGATQEAAFDLTRDLPALEVALANVIAPALIVIDPVTAYMGDTDSHKNAEVRAVLAQLAHLAEGWNVAVVCVTHLNKASTMSAIYRAMGSLAFVAAARAVHAVVRDRDDPQSGRRLFLPVKNNLGNDHDGLAYVLRATATTNGQPQVCWEAEPVTVTADDALEGPRSKPGPDAEEQGRCVEWLRSALASGPRPTKDVEQEGKQAHCFSAATIKRAREALGVRAYRDQIPGPWLLRLPD
jgi:hypothetical protein